jgi:hypothetical protein
VKKYPTDITTWRLNPEDHDMDFYRRENLKSSLFCDAMSVGWVDESRGAVQEHVDYCSKQSGYKNK